MKRVVLVASTRAYQTDDFAAAARKMNIELTLATDRCHILAEAWPHDSLALDFRDPERAAHTIVQDADTRPLAGIVPTDEITAVIAARAASQLGLRGTSPRAAGISGNKLRLRQALARAGLPGPAFAVFSAQAPPAPDQLAECGLTWPVVIKPLHLSASRGVMRADSPDTLARRWARLAALLDNPDVAAADPEAARHILVESFLSGREVAFEGLLSRYPDHNRATLHDLAVFDKPDPLDGPFFAETLYVTPSTEAPATRAAITEAVAAAASAIGLENGPVHAELRLTRTESGAIRPVVLELASRSIGGLCSRIFHFATGIGLQELILAHACGADVAETAAHVRQHLDARGAAGVLMMPVPKAGVLRAVRNLDDARAIAGVRDIFITARSGDAVVPLPEGHTYMGFCFATADHPYLVTSALHAVSDLIDFDIAPIL